MSTVPLRERGTVTFKPPACRTLAGVHAQALPLRRQRGRDEPRCRIGRVGRALPRAPRAPAPPGEAGTPPIDGRYPVLMQAATIRRDRRRRWLRLSDTRGREAVMASYARASMNRFRPPCGEAPARRQSEDGSGAHRPRRRDCAVRAGRAGCRRNASVARGCPDPNASGSPRRAGLDHDELLIRRRNLVRRWAWLPSAGWSAGRR